MSATHLALAALLLCLAAPAHGALTEHDAAMSLVPAAEVTHVVRHSGRWSDPATWQGGVLPGRGAKVHIPAGTDVVMDVSRKDVLSWVRVDGKLSFRTDRDTTLAVRSLVIGDEGRLHIGTVDDPVRGNVKARIAFAPRGPRDRLHDPYDLAGGLVSLGEVQMVAAPKTPHASSDAAITRGATRLRLASAARGWRAGDAILVPGVVAGRDQDEIRTLVAMEDGDRTALLDRRLSHDHAAPRGVSIPVANLSRNIEIGSLRAEPLGARGHMMVMHRESGTLIDGAAFIDLGRTDARFAHTIPAVGADGRTVAGTDANSIGRYAVHFHVRSGGRMGVAPHVVRNSVVLRSPKYGIVNHGGNVVAEDNITFRVAGSHFVAENGSELGAFRRNVAIRSSGSGESAIENRMTIYDFGHTGHGFWLQGPAVELSDNWASGHEHAAVFYMGMPFKDGGREVFFDAANIGDLPDVEDVGGGRMRTSDVTFRYLRNTAAGSRLGMELWYHKIHSNPREYSEIDGLVVWNVADSALSLAYTTHVRLRNAMLAGSKREHIPGVLSNGFTADIVIEGAEIRDFDVGVRVPERGRSVLRDVTLQNNVDLVVPAPNAAGRELQMTDVRFGAPSSRQVVMGEGQPGRGLDALAWPTPDATRPVTLEYSSAEPSAPAATVDPALLPRSARPGYLRAPPGVKFMLRRALLPLQIHPDDVAHGYRFAGLLIERSEGRLVWQTYSQEHRRLKVDPDGFVRIDFQLPDLSGRLVDFQLGLQVTQKALRRGPNIDFWAQRAYCGRCGLDTIQADAARYFKTGRLEPLPVVAGSCQRGKDAAIELARPFTREKGHAYVVHLPELAHAADGAAAPRRSPYLVCEEGRVFGLPHALHDDIRNSGRGDFSHWNTSLYFSSSDGTDPNTNGRRYFLVRPAVAEVVRLAAQ